MGSVLSVFIIPASGASDIWVWRQWGTRKHPLMNHIFPIQLAILIRFRHPFFRNRSRKRKLKTLDLCLDACCVREVYRGWFALGTWHICGWFSHVWVRVYESQVVPMPAAVFSAAGSFWWPMLEARPGFDAFLDGFKGTVRSGDIGFDRSLLAKHQYFSDHPKWSKKWSQNAVRIISVRRKPSYLWGTCWVHT